MQRYAKVLQSIALPVALSFYRVFEGILNYA